MALKERFGPDSILFDDGTLVREQAILVYVAGTLGLAQLYSDILGAGLAPNPVTTDEYGNLSFYADPGEYELELNGYRVRVTLESSGGAGSGIQYDQVTPTSQVTIPHALGRIPDVTLFVGGSMILTDVTATAAQVTITFPSPTAFTAVIH